MLHARGTWILGDSEAKLILPKLNVAVLTLLPLWPYWRLRLEEVIKIKWGHLEAWSDITCTFIRRDTPECLFMCPQEGEAMWGHSEKAEACKPGRELSQETELAGTLVLDFVVSRTSEMYIFCLSHPVFDSLLWQPE